MTIEIQTPSDPTAVPAASPVKKVNWKQVGAFIGLTFGLTWLLDLFLYLKGGLSNPAVTLALQFQMLLPAFSAILLGMFFFKDSPIHILNNRSKFPRVGQASATPSEGHRERGEQVHKWFTWFFLFFTLLYAAAVVLAFLRPELLQTRL